MAESSTMGSGVPLLNDYKKDFLKKRFPQTLLGGPKFKFTTCAPFYVYFNQIILFLMPWLLGGIFTVLMEYAELDEAIAGSVCGACVVIFVILSNITGILISRKTDTQVHPSKSGPSNLLAEDDER